MNKKNKSLIALLLVLCVGLVGLTIAYFSNSDTIENQFITKEYGTTYTEEFVSPDNWLPGDTTDKTIVATNTGQVDEAVRISLTESWTTHNNGTLNGWIHPDGTKSNHTTEEELSNDESVAILNLANTSDWTKVGDYYYYNYKLAPGESTTSFLESVTFNSKTKLDDTCVTTIDGSTKTVTCSSSGDDYDNATYKLTFTIETVQYNKYNEAWNLNNTVTIAEERPETGTQTLLSKVNPISITNYTDGDIHEMYTFEHEATEQTGALTDYRYIGDDPYNYVYFNCDDLNNQSNETCEVWRIIGVFDVDDGSGIYEKRIKLVRGYLFSEGMTWNSENNNNWITSDIKEFVNGDYYNRTGSAKDYGLKTSAKNMISNAKFYLGGHEKDNYGSAQDIYVWERGTSVYSGNSTEWIGTIGLMYPSDNYYTYAKGVDNVCYNDPRNCISSQPWGSVSNPGLHTKGWIHNSNILDGQEDNFGVTWFISSSSDNSEGVFNMTSTTYYGYLTANPAYDYTAYGGSHSIYNFGVRPVVYLSSSVQIVDGDGTSGNPYVLTY